MREFAKQHGLTIKFRSYPSNAGDFCIYIYDKKFRDGYIVGFDGSNVSHTANLDSCIRMAYKWIVGRDRRFAKDAQGNWLYKPYNVCYWKDNYTNGGQLTFLKMEDAEKAAQAKYEEGYTSVNIVDIDIKTGKSKLLKEYGKDS